jgi:L-malate glycosyltransferase
MNILHTTTFLNGGAGRVLVDLALFQLEAGHKVCVIANKSEFDGYNHYEEHIGRLRESGVSFETYDSLFKRESVLNQKAEDDLRNRFSTLGQFDVVHAHASVPAKVCRAAFHSSRPEPFFVQTMHGWGLNKTKLMEEDDVKTMNALNGVAVLNKSGKRLLASKGVANSHLHVIPNGISSQLPAVSGLSKELSQFMRSRKWDMKFLCIGEVGERKNQLFLMRAIQRLNKSGVNCCAVFIGPEQDEGYYNECVKESSLDSFTYWTGELQNASSYMPHFDAVVLPSKSEGMPISILEAFRANVLVLGSRISEIEELLSDQRGYLFDIESTQEFVGRVTDFDSRAVQGITDNAHTFFCNKYTLRTMAEAYFKLYRNESQCLSR